MIIYNWNCKTVEVKVKENEKSNVIFTVHYIVTGVSESVDEKGNFFTSTSIGTHNLLPPSGENFLEIEDVTNDDIVLWVKSSMGEEEVLRIEDSILKTINNQIEPKTKIITIS